MCSTVGHPTFASPSGGSLTDSMLVRMPIMIKFCRYPVVNIVLVIIFSQAYYVCVRGCSTPELSQTTNLSSSEKKAIGWLRQKLTVTLYVSCWATTSRSCGNYCDCIKRQSGEVIRRAKSLRGFKQIQDFRSGDCCVKPEVNSEFFSF